MPGTKEKIHMQIFGHTPLSNHTNFLYVQMFLLDEVIATFFLQLIILIDLRPATSTLSIPVTKPQFNGYGGKEGVGC